MCPMNLQNTKIEVVGAYCHEHDMYQYVNWEGGARRSAPRNGGSGASRGSSNNGSSNSGSGNSGSRAGRAGMGSRH
jgi:hypothetical protein